MSKDILELLTETAKEKERDRRREMYEKVALIMLEDEVLAIMKQESKAVFWDTIGKIAEDLLKESDKFAEKES